MKKEYIKPSIAQARKRSLQSSNIIQYEIEPAYQSLGTGKNYLVITHGCQANVRDSETVAGLLESVGFTSVSEIEDADIIIINTCAIRSGAEDKVYGQIGALKKYKKAKPELIIGLCGCMAQEEKTIENIINKYPWVEIVFGTHNITSLPKLINDVMQKQQRMIEVYSKEGDVVENVPVARFMNHKAWVNIMYGCDKFCTYCIVPYTRGKQRSRLLSDVVQEVKELVEQGYKEVCLLGQNVNAYGKDLSDGSNFADLLNAVAATGIPRIRFVTSHPWDFTEEMILAMKNNPNICPYLHLPVQSGSNDVLKRMNRHYDIETYKALVDKIKEHLPHYAITTDIIVGFPNETDEDFEKTLEIVDYVQYDNAFTFIFSPREGTPAAMMEDKTPLSIKEERLQRLNKKVAEYANAKNQPFLNRTVEVLVDGLSKKNDQIYSGYTIENKLVNFKAKDVQIGDLVKVKITEVLSFSLNGEMVE